MPTPTARARAVAALPDPIDGTEAREFRPGAPFSDGGADGNMDSVHLPPEHPEREAKGDLGLMSIKNFPARANFEEGEGYSPFAGLKRGK